MTATADRLDLRLSSEDKNRLRRAAALKSMPVAAFVREAALLEADATISRPPKAPRGSLVAHIGRHARGVLDDEVVRGVGGVQFPRIAVRPQVRVARAHPLDRGVLGPGAQGVPLQLHALALLHLLAGDGLAGLVVHDARDARPQVQPVDPHEHPHGRVHARGVHHHLRLQCGHAVQVRRPVGGLRAE